MPQYLRPLGESKCEPREVEDVIDFYWYWRFYRIQEQRFLDDLHNIGAIVKSAVILIDPELSKVSGCLNRDARVVHAAFNARTMFNEVRILGRMMEEIKELP
jgi:hypothetical protein